MIVESSGNSRDSCVCACVCFLCFFLQVEQSAHRLTEAGASVIEVSIPMHLNGSDIWTAVGVSGMFVTQYMTGASQFSSRRDCFPVHETISHTHTLSLALSHMCYVVDVQGVRVFKLAR